MTHDVGMIETLEDAHLAPHALLVPLDLLLRDRLERDLARDVPGRGRRREGTSRGRDRERGGGARVGRGGASGAGGRRGWAGRAPLGEGPLFGWDVPCRTLTVASGG
jgi:hypothetical protein